jgi:hypothetical protein
MKKLSFIAALLFAFATLSFGQDAAKPADKKMDNKMSKPADKKMNKKTDKKMNKKMDNKMAKPAADNKM